MTSTPYRDLSVDLVNPRTKRDACAQEILNLLPPGQPVLANQLDVALAALQMSRIDKAQALKALRNKGYDIVATKRRHLSAYVLTPPSQECAEMSRQDVSSLLSLLATRARQYAGDLVNRPNDLMLFNTHHQVVTAAMYFGGQLGYTHQEVLTMCAPLP
jgi:hypothetical protein